MLVLHFPLSSFIWFLVILIYKNSFVRCKRCAQAYLINYFEKSSVLFTLEMWLVSGVLVVLPNVQSHSMFSQFVLLFFAWSISRVTLVDTAHGYVLGVSIWLPQAPSYGLDQTAGFSSLSLSSSSRLFCLSVCPQGSLK